MPKRIPARVLVAGLLFTVSGFAALVYQVSWQRILVLHSGVGIYSVAMIVSGFLAGLGLGSHIGGVLSKRARRRQSLYAFAALELSIGVFAAASCWLYYDVFYREMAWLYASAWSTGITHFVALLLPTTMMGMTLPFLVRAMVRDVETASLTIGYLYGVNIVGAAAGALLTPWVLIRLAGVEGAVLVGVGCNLAVAAAAFVLAKRAEEEPFGVEREMGAAAPGARRLAMWLGLYGLGGFSALSLQIVWFRVMDVAVKSTAFTFGSVLAVYLLGLAAGSLASAPLAPRWKRPLEVYLTLQCAILIYSGLALFLLVTLPSALPGYSWYLEYWSGFHAFRLGSSWQIETLLPLYLVLPALLYGFPTVLMGAAFPVLHRAVQDDPATSGFKVGILQAANVVGNVAGCLLVGLVALNVLGTTGTMRALLLLGLPFAFVGVKRFGLRGRFSPAAIMLVALALGFPGQNAFWLPLHGNKAGTLIEEDATSVIAVRPLTPGRWRVMVNGQSHSWLPFGGIHTILGILPVLMHHAPKDVAVIGLGSGDTAWAAGARAETTSIDVFEIAAPQERLLRELAESDDPWRIRPFLADQRVSFLTADGRNAMKRSAKKYDVIEMDALLPHHGFSGNLYSVEFFEEMALRLEVSGLMCVWSATERVRSSFTKVFPYVVEFGDVNHGPILVGSAGPIPIDPDTWVERLESRAVSRYLGFASAGIDEILRSAAPLVIDDHPEVTLNRDLFPRDELMLLRPGGELSEE
jgi:spermidine synthase